MTVIVKPKYGGVANEHGRTGLHLPTRGSVNRGGSKGGRCRPSPKQEDDWAQLRMLQRRHERQCARVLKGRARKGYERENQWF